MAKSWDFFQDVIIENISRFTLLAVILLAFLEVIRRYIFGATFLWYEDVEVYFHLVAVLLYFGVAQKLKANIKLDLVVELLKKRQGRWRRAGEIIEIGSDALSLSFCVLFVWFGIDFVEVGIAVGRRTENADLLMWPFYVVLLVGFAFVAVEFGRSLYCGLRRFFEGHD